MKFPVGMALIITAFMLLLIGIATLSGCDFLTHVLTEADKIESEPVGLSEEEAWEKAVEIALRVHQKRVEILKEVVEDDITTATEGSKALGALLKEETGFGYDIWSPLHEIYRLKGNPNIYGEIKPNLEELTDLDIIAEYLKLSFQYPEKSQEELSILFTESVVNGNVKAMVSEVEEKFGGNIDLSLENTEDAEKPPTEHLEPLSEKEARKKAVEIVKKMQERLFAIRTAAKAANDFTTLDDDSFQVKFEETGLTPPERGRLSDIHDEENPEDREEVEIYLDHGLVIEYLRLSFQYPEKSKEELFELFREAARNGETEVERSVVEKHLRH